MRDVFFTILIIWVLWRIFSSRTVVQTFTINTQNNHPPKGEPDAKGGVKIDHVPPPKDKKKGNDDGEYVDFEEIKP